MQKANTLEITDVCPACHKTYSPSSIKLLDHLHEHHLVYCQCNYCLTSALMLVSFNNNGINSIKLMTDLGHKEILVYSQQVNANIDDYIEIYKLLYP